MKNKNLSKTFKYSEDLANKLLKYPRQYAKIPSIISNEKIEQMNYEPLNINKNN